jgi:hypothetical protein
MSGYPYFIPSKILQSSESVPIERFEDSIAVGGKISNDILNLREAIDIKIGRFDESTDPKNADDTYKRLIHKQIKNLFYNKTDFYNSLGFDNIDVVLDGKHKHLYDKAKVITIPQIYYGEQVVEGSLKIDEREGEQAYTLVDDGKGNVICDNKIFSEILTDECQLVALNSSSYVDVDVNGAISIDGKAVDVLNWVYNDDHIVFLKRNQIHNFHLSHYQLDETPPYYYNSNICFIGSREPGNLQSIHQIPSQSYTIESALLGEFSKIECGNDFGMALDGRGQVKIWGARATSLYGNHYFHLSQSWNVTDNSLSEREFDSSVVDISASETFAAILTEAGRLYLWTEAGSAMHTAMVSVFMSDSAVLGQKFKYIQSSVSGIAAVTETGKIVSIGTSAFLSLASLPTGSIYSRVAIGRGHGLLLDINGNTSAWGSDEFSQQQIPAQATTNVIDISCGNNHNIVLRTDGSVISWGDNTLNQSFIPFGVTLDDWGLDNYTGKKITATFGLNDVIGIKAKYDRTSVRIQKPCSLDSNVIVWGYEGLLSKYKIKEYGLGADYTLVDLDNDYQYVVYHPRFNYSKYSHLVFDDGLVSASIHINLLKLNQYHSYNTYIKTPTLISDDDELFLDAPVANFSRTSVLNNEEKDYLILSCDSFIRKLGLSNLQNNYFYTQTIPLVDFIVKEKSAEPLNCLPISDVGYFVHPLDFYYYIIEGSYKIYLVEEPNFWRFLTEPFSGDGNGNAWIIVETTYDNYELPYVFSANLLEIENQVNCINV